MRPGIDFPDAFVQDTFAARRGGPQGVKDSPVLGSEVFFSGCGYDPESLLTGGEIEAGLGYGDPRVFPDAETYRQCILGNVPVEDIPQVAPRQPRPPQRGFHATAGGVASWQDLREVAELDQPWYFGDV